MATKKKPKMGKPIHAIKWAAPRKLPPPPPNKPAPPAPVVRKTAESFGVRRPAHLKGEEANEEFDRIVTELKGVVRPVDLSLIVDYSLLHQDCILLRQKADSEPEILEGMKGGSYVNPIQNLLISKQNSLASLRRDLYFTPKSRAEKTKPKGKAEGILAALRAGKDSDSVANEAEE